MRERQHAQGELERLRNLREHASGLAAGHEQVRADSEDSAAVDQQGNVDLDASEGNALDTAQGDGVAENWDLLSAADAVTPLRNVGQSAYLAAIRKHEHAVLTDGGASWGTASEACVD